MINKKDVLQKEKRINKPWGHERWIAYNDKYVLKILRIEEGERLSLQFHKKKDETLYLGHGEVKLTLGHKDSPEDLKTVTWREGEIMRFEPGIIHRMEGVEDSVILEVSTPELDDVVRLEDDYKRK